mgnify:CR=1 FL=1
MKNQTQKSGKEMLRDHVQHIVETIETGEYEPNDEDCGCEGYWWGDTVILSYHNDELGLADAVATIYNC